MEGEEQKTIQINQSMHIPHKKGQIKVLIQTPQNPTKKPVQKTNEYNDLHVRSINPEGSHERLKMMIQESQTRHILKVNWPNLEDT